MSDRPYHSRVAIAFLGDSSGWGAIEATTEAVAMYLRIQADDRANWLPDAVATAGSVKVSGRSVGEIRGAWKRQHLAPDGFTITLYGQGGSARELNLTMHLTPTRRRHGVEWGGSIAIAGPNRMIVESFAANLCLAVRTWLRSRYLAAEVVQVETADLRPLRFPPASRGAELSRPTSSSTLLERVKYLVANPGETLPDWTPPSGSDSSAVLPTPARVDDELVPLIGSAFTSEAESTTRPKHQGRFMKATRETVRKAIPDVVSKVIVGMIVALVFPK